MSKIEKVCSTCKHELRDEHCLGCTFDWKNADGNTHWEPSEEYEQTCHEDKVKVLEKIRAEIEQNAYPIVHGVNNHELGMTLYGILQIIDRYTKDGE